MVSLSHSQWYISLSLELVKITSCLDIFHSCMLPSHYVILHCPVTQSTKGNSNSSASSRNNEEDAVLHYKNTTAIWPIKFNNNSFSYYGAWQHTYAVFVIVYLFFFFLSHSLVSNLINDSTVVITLLQAWSPMWDIIRTFFPNLNAFYSATSFPPTALPVLWEIPANCRKVSHRSRHF